ncbi:MAG: aminoglycoside 3'-phosphotransferase [Eubacteriales bacterium]|nr:aminoglycoside 3'-phosphotransferase [Eubacteriales bacterium]
MDELKVPEAIRTLLQGHRLRANTIGRSGARVLMDGELVLKVQPSSPDAERETALLGWLDGKLPVPRLLAVCAEGGLSYTLMSRIPGRMACEEVFLDRPDWLLDRLASAMRMLWAVDPAGCPVLRTPAQELALARERVARGLVDIEDAEPETFGPGGFRDPEALLHWLEDNAPPCEPVFTHGDCCLPNIFLTESGGIGFVDLGSAGLGDRWRDIALCHRSLRHNTDGRYGLYKPGFRPDRLFDHLGFRPDEERLRWYRLLDELF